MHVSGPKSDYDHRLLSQDRAMLGGIDDVGIGALFGLVRALLCRRTAHSRAAVRLCVERLGGGFVRSGGEGRRQRV